MASLPPLSHHAILALLPPFAQRGLQPDLAASDRAARRLLFQPQLLAAPACTATLQLQQQDSGRWQLVRTLRHAGGLVATLDTEGDDPGVLLQRLDALPPVQQLQPGAGFVCAFSHTFGAGGDGSTGARMTQAALQCDALQLELKVPAVQGIAAEVMLRAPRGDLPWLPDDLLAVLGWHWSRLRRRQDGWHATLLLRGAGAVRSADAQAKLLATAQHLARTLAEPPLAFHQRLLRRRWAVTARRAVPALVCLALIGGAAAVPQLGLADNSMAWMLIFNLPPVLMVAFFAMREMPTIEIPPLPRRPRAAAWRSPEPAPAPAPASASAHASL